MPDNRRKETRSTQTYVCRDRRESSRIPDMDGTRVHFFMPELGDRVGQLEEVSLGGFAMRVSESSRPAPGQEMTAYFRDDKIRAIVKYVSAAADDGYRVGAEWIHPKSSTVISLLRGCLER